MAGAIAVTPAALDAVRLLVEQMGPVMFFQSGGCCDGSLPMCFQDGELIVGDSDVLLGRIAGCPFYIDQRQWERWKHSNLILDVAEGLPEGFSLPAPPDRHFVTRSSVMVDPGSLADHDNRA